MNMTKGCVVGYGTQNSAFERLRHLTPSEVEKNGGEVGLVRDKIVEGLSLSAIEEVLSEELNTLLKKMAEYLDEVGMLSLTFIASTKDKRFMVRMAGHGRKVNFPRDISDEREITQEVFEGHPYFFILDSKRWEN